MQLESVLYCALIVETLLVIWFKSPIQDDLKFFTKIPLQDYLALRCPFLAKLSSCHICLSFWFSLFIGLFIFDLGKLFLCVPGLLYLINRKVF